MGTLYCKKHRPSDETLNRGPDSLWSLKIPGCPSKKNKKRQKIQKNNGGQIYCGCMWVPGAVRYYFVLLQKQEYILQRDWSCLAEAPPMTRIRICCVVNFTREWSVFHARMNWISRANEASKLKMFKHPTTREYCDLFASFVIRIWCERTLRVLPRHPDQIFPLASDHHGLLIIPIHWLASSHCLLSTS